MSLEGSLTDIPLAELFQIISMANKSGSIVLHTVGASAEILLSEGKVCAVCRSTSTITVGEILFQDGVISPQQYQEMMYHHRHEPGNMAFQPPEVWQRYGIDPEEVQATLRSAVEQHIYPMFEWDGTFDYTVDDNIMDSYRLLSVNSTMIVTTNGINPQFLAMEGTRLLDEKRRNDPFDGYMQHKNGNKEPPVTTKVTTEVPSLAHTPGLSDLQAVLDGTDAPLVQQMDEFSDEPFDITPPATNEVADEAVMVAITPPAPNSLVRRNTQLGNIAVEIDNNHNDLASDSGAINEEPKAANSDLDKSWLAPGVVPLPDINDVFEPSVAKSKIEEPDELVSDEDPFKDYHATASLSDENDAATMDMLEIPGLEPETTPVIKAKPIEKIDLLPDDLEMAPEDNSAVEIPVEDVDRIIPAVNLPSATTIEDSISLSPLVAAQLAMASDKTIAETPVAPKSAVALLDLDKITAKTKPVLHATSKLSSFLPPSLIKTDNCQSLNVTVPSSKGHEDTAADDANDNVTAEPAPLNVQNQDVVEPTATAVADNIVDNNSSDKDNNGSNNVVEEIATTVSISQKEDFAPASAQQFEKNEVTKEVATQSIVSANENVAEEVYTNQPETIEASAVQESPTVAPTTSPLAEIAAKFNGPVKFIIIDDDDIYLRQLAQGLSPLANEIATYKSVKTGLDAVKALVDQGAQIVVIADLIIARSDSSGILGGLEVLSTVKEINKEIPIILVTDFNNEDAKKEALEQGVSYFINKPRRGQMDPTAPSKEMEQYIGQMNRLLLPFAKAKASAEVATDNTPTTTNSPFDLGAELSDELKDVALGLKVNDQISVADNGPKEMVALRAMLSELNNNASNVNIALLILRFAADLLPRAAFFMVTKEQAIGLGGFSSFVNGGESNNFVQRIRELKIPLSEESIFQTVVNFRIPYRGFLPKSAANELIAKTLGPERPSEIFVAPIISGNRVAAVLYGDTTSSCGALENTQGLEIFLLQAGLAMERSFLERKLHEASQH